VSTEGTHERLPGLDETDPEEIARLFALEAAEAARAVESAAPFLAEAMRAVADCFSRGGNVIYAGAGTSGRLAAMDAAEMPPTFGVDSARFHALIAGSADRAAKEASEDDTAQAIADFDSVMSGNCVVIGVSASGTTPYVLEVVREANKRGLVTIGIANNPDTPLLEAAKIAILLDTGPEVLAGSTRLKAGTAQKVALNAISTGAMALAGRIRGHDMTHMKPLNAKLRRRAIAIVARQLGVPEADAEERLLMANWSLPDALGQR
jgi:N-acetylmuramic acid 6-phosphate etherase